MFKRIFKNRINEIHGRYKEKQILIADDISNFFGLESAGVWKVRGNGVLILTEDDLFFGMWKPKKDLLIPVKSIIEVTNPKSHMQRSVFRPLLKVTFKDQNGETDSAAWFVRDIEKWNENIRQLML